MSQIHPVQILLDDHRMIEAVLNVFETRLLALPAEPLPISWLAGTAQFFRYFAEACHRDKEEQLVFPCLRSDYMPEKRDLGAEYLDRLEANLQAAERGDRAAIGRVRMEGLGYARFLREHIAREDDLLRWFARQPASAADIRRLTEGVSPENFHQMDDDAYESYLTRAHALCAAGAVDDMGGLAALIGERICSVCVDRNADGSCDRSAAGTCLLMAKLPLVAEAILRVRSNMIDPYIQSIRDHVCAACELRLSDGSCERRDTDRCTLDSYLPLVVEAVEESCVHSFAPSAAATRKTGAGAYDAAVGDWHSVGACGTPSASGLSPLISSN